MQLPGFQVLHVTLFINTSPQATLQHSLLCLHIIFDSLFLSSKGAALCHAKHIAQIAFFLDIYHKWNSVETFSSFWVWFCDTCCRLLTRQLLSHKMLILPGNYSGESFDAFVAKSSATTACRNIIKGGTLYLKQVCDSGWARISEWFEWQLCLGWKKVRDGETKLPTAAG